MAEATEPVSGAAATERKRHSLLADIVAKLLRRKPLGLLGFIIFLLLFFTGIFANFLAPYGYKEMHLAYRLSPPGTAGFLLGTDSIGRDMLSRLIYGARISMLVGVLGTGISVAVSTIIGVVSGYLGGKVDLIVQRFVDAWMCFPWLIIIITIMSLVGSGMFQLIFVLGISGGIGGSRVMRSAVISIRENVYMLAARAIGCSTGRIFTRHVLPNIVAPVIVLFTIGMGGIILAEAALSFLGYGIPPPAPSWGGMLSGPGRSYMLQAPWLALLPGLALSVAVFGINMFGDAVRDLLDPKLRGGVGRLGTHGAKSVKKAIRGISQPK